MYKSLFERLQNYESDPIDEYHKISTFLDDAIVERYNKIHLNTLLSDAFLFCKEFRCYFASLDDCVDSNCSNIWKYQCPAKSYYQSLDENDRDILLDEFLTYCQILLTCLSYFREHSITILNKYFVNGINWEIVDQFEELVIHSLNCFNYKSVSKKDSLNVEIVMINPVAEVVALESTKHISEAIFGYLANRDIKTKEKFLHDFIDLLEPTFKKYSDQGLVKKIREYIQLLRHPETKKDDTDYQWYFKNKKKYIDKLFELCLFVQQYDLSKAIVAEFEDNKKTSHNN